MAAPSDLIRAARLTEHGRPLTVTEVPLPQPAEDEVIVDLAFAGVNPIDRYIAEGRVAADGPLPRTLGGEAAGHVDGQAVLVAGERLGSGRDGLWAQAAVVPRAAVIDLPAGVEPRDAAAMGIAGLTALNCVRSLAQVGPEDRVFVLGASGGVGSMIVSLARAAGATVWGQTGSQSKAAGITEMGAARVLVGDAEQVATELAEFAPTVGFDPLGDGFVAPLVDAVAARGRIVSFGTSAGAEVTFNMQQLYRKMVSLLGYGGMQLTRDERRPGLERALEALRSGDLRVRVDEILPLDQINEAFQRLVDRGVQGKLLLEL
ncbi:MAG TPA: zinc-binding alcohol dehydrogenase family protein [Solirubrobacteraceae bacterium]|nr:zinc-binding alcohol dehydrogenase family protein [Solirubrobacteraceae bacterium]